VTAKIETPGFLSSSRPNDALNSCGFAEHRSLGRQDEARSSGCVISTLEVI